MKRLFAFMLLCTFSLSTAYAGWYCVIPGKDSIQIKSLTDSLCKLQGGVAYDTQKEANRARKRMYSDGDAVTMKYDGGTYTGETVNGVPNGHGTSTYWSTTTNTGLKYVGHWKDGKPNGQGVITYSDGYEDIGEFKKGELWDVKSYYPSGKLAKVTRAGKTVYEVTDTVQIPPIPNFTQDDSSDYEVQCGGRDTETRSWVEGTCYSGEFQGRDTETRAWVEGYCEIGGVLQARNSETRAWIEGDCDS